MPASPAHEPLPSGVKQTTCPITACRRTNLWLMLRLLLACAAARDATQDRRDDEENGCHDDQAHCAKPIAPRMLLMASASAP